ncbi:MAG: hypothetical protein ACRDPJ_10325 [Nocardioidaceae bacterium]
MPLAAAKDGAARLAYNHDLGRVRANLDQRTAERSYGIADADLTPSLSWSKVSFINEMNEWKDGRAADARVSVDEDGNEVRGLPWRHEVSTDVFECASVKAAQALKNWSGSRTGRRAGRAAGFPRFKSRHKTAPCLHGGPGEEPTATSHHEEALGRNQHKTTGKDRWRLEGNQEPSPGRGWGKGSR